MNPSIRSTRSLCRLALAGALLAPAAPLAAQEIGRLFFTPQQRQELDRRRNTNVVADDAIVEGPMTINGHVARSSGKTTTWVNGAPQYDAYRSGDPARVPMASGDRTIAVKVGETLDRGRGEVKDELQGGVVRVRPAGGR